jgi:hypothetical protein
VVITGAMLVTKIFLLVVSLWGYNGDSWVYTGNQMVLQQKFESRQICEDLGRKFMKYEQNRYFSFKVQCVEDINKET